MSASQEKKTRAELRSEGNDKKVNAAAEKVAKDKKFRRNAIIAAIIVVIVIVGAIIVNSNLFYTKSTAVQIGDTKYNAAETNCYYQMAYNTVYNQFYQTYGDYTSYFLDPSKPLSEQQYSEDQTWADYIKDITLANMKQITALYDDAMKNGYTLTEEDTASIDSSVESMRSTAISYGYESLNAFLAANYGGKGTTEQIYRDVLTKTTVAYSYAASVSDSFTYSEDELKSYYAERADDLDIIAYNVYYVGSTEEAFADLAEDAQMTAAHDAAVEIAKATTTEDFTAAVRAFTGEESTVNISYNQGQSISDTFRAWLLDSSRTVGDATVIDADSGSYALLYLGRDNNDYKMTSMRHILINAEADENGEYTDEALAAAKARAEELLAEWQENPNESNFASLAMTYSEDTGSNTNGGLYEDIYRHNMVEEIDAFLFDSGAQPGDTTVVYGSNGAYAGYHVVYFVGEGDVFSDYLAEGELRNAAYGDYVAALEAQYETSEGFGMKFTDMN